MHIEIDYEPRKHFADFHERPQRFACLVCHRGAGKTIASVNELQRAALLKPGPDRLYGYVAPFLKQAKANAWTPLLRAASPLRQIGATTNESELRVDYPNYNRVRLFGGDNPDSLRGLHFDGIVLDEMADMDPSLWPTIVLPALMQRQGWAVQIGTPRGHNHFYDTYQRALANPSDWFALMLRVQDTGLLTAADIELIKRETSAERYAQEYECSFESALQGAFYATELRRAQEDGRVGKIPIDRGLLVNTTWDLGVADSTAIWFIQVAGHEYRLIDYYETSGVGLDHYAAVLKDKGYNYDQHYFPHDVAVRELSSGKSRVDTLKSLGIKATYPNKATNVLDGINAVRRLLDQCWIDEKRTGRGYEALKQYQREWDDRLQDWKTRPLHNWASHGADALRTFATQYRPRTPLQPLSRLLGRGGGASEWMAS